MTKRETDYPSKKWRNQIHALRRRKEWLESDDRITSRSANARNYDIVEIAALNNALRALRWIEERGLWGAMENDLATDKRPGSEYEPTCHRPTDLPAKADPAPDGQPVAAARREVD